MNNKYFVIMVNIGGNKHYQVCSKIDAEKDYGERNLDLMPKKYDEKSNAKIVANILNGQKYDVGELSQEVLETEEISALLDLDNLDEELEI
ncbi:MAG: hypothetical protein WBO70_02030 [Erysipelotrichaceae bacterium]